MVIINNSDAKFALKGVRCYNANNCIENRKEYFMESNNSNNDKPRISLNRKMRMWNRYRNYIIGLAVVVVAVAIFAIVLKSCGSKNDTKNNTETASSPAVTQEETTAKESGSETLTTEAVQTTQAAAAGRSLSISGEPDTQDYTSSEQFSKSVFIGDFVISGVSGFGFVSESQVIASNSMTSDKLTNHTDEIVAQSPDSVYIMVGINDLNYGSRPVDNIYEYEKEFIEELKSRMPTTNIYVLSVLPVSKRFESSSKVKQTNIDALNTMFSENAASLGITYIDVASPYKDGTGYLAASYTDSGYNLKSGYYAFMLNGIAGVIR